MGKSWLTKSFLFIALCSFSFVLAILIYIVFYFLMIPPTFYRMPLFFDFSSPYPVAMVKLPCKKLRYMNQLEGTLHVCFPDSPRNMNLGMLKFTLELLDTHETLFYSRFRPTILRYKNDLEIKMETWTQLVFLLFGWKFGIARIQGKDLILRIWINKADVEVYHSELLLKGRLRVYGFGRFLFFALAHFG
ncbi:hypothetical protein Gasu2_41970 [Galdieria sulphuraria]|nr:hypothetical protein Gasu2_41970 [Galdieria sulphuraria]